MASLPPSRRQSSLTRLLATRRCKACSVQIYEKHCEACNSDFHHDCIPGFAERYPSVICRKLFPRAKTRDIHTNKDLLNLSGISSKSQSHKHTSFPETMTNNSKVNSMHGPSNFSPTTTLPNATINRSSTPLNHIPLIPTSSAATFLMLKPARPKCNSEFLRNALLQAITTLVARSSALQQKINGVRYNVSMHEQRPLV